MMDLINKIIKENLKLKAKIDISKIIELKRKFP